MREWIVWLWDAVEALQLARRFVDVEDLARRDQVLREAEAGLIWVILQLGQKTENPATRLSIGASMGLEFFSD